MAEMVSLRVHISPVGFEVRRVVEPLVRLRADRVYLLSGSPDDAAADYWGQIKRALALEFPAVEAREEFADVWSLPELLDRFRRIVLAEQEQGNQVFVNVSTGTKMTSLAGFLSSMLWGTRPYYVRASRSSQTESVHSVTFLPVLRVAAPRQEDMAVLEALRDARAPLAKQRLISALRERGLLPATHLISEPASYNRLQSIIGRLVEAGFVSTDGQRSRARVHLTESGRDLLLLLSRGSADSRPLRR